MRPVYRKIKPTSVDGKPYSDENVARTWREWNKSLFTPGYKVEDGENFDKITDRASRALSFLEARDEQTFVIVTHGHFLRTIIAKVLLGDYLTPEILQRFISLTTLENTAITVLNYTDAFEEDFCWRLWTLNDHAHFAE